MLEPRFSRNKLVIRVCPCSLESASALALYFSVSAAEGVGSHRRHGVDDRHERGEATASSSSVAAALLRISSSIESVHAVFFETPYNLLQDCGLSSDDCCENFPRTVPGDVDNQRCRVVRGSRETVTRHLRSFLCFFSLKSTTFSLGNSKIECHVSFSATVNPSHPVYFPVRACGFWMCANRYFVARQPRRVHRTGEEVGRVRR